MAFSSSIDPDRKLVTIVGGDAPFAAWQKMMLEFLADPRYEPGFRILADHRGPAQEAPALRPSSRATTWAR